MERKLLIIVVLWVLNVSIFASSSKLDVTGMENQVVKLGDSTTLICSTQEAHDECHFITPAKTSLIIDPEVKFGRIVYHGDHNLRDCGIKITDITEEDDGEWVCIVREGSREGVQKANVTVMGLPGLPVFLNNTTEIFVETGNEENIEFQFISNPEVTEGKWHLHLGGKKTILQTNLGDNNKNLSQMSTTDESRYTTEILNPGSESWLYIAKLTIDSVHKTDANSQNKLVIKNSIGETELLFTLIAEKSGGNAATIAAVVATLVILAGLVVGITVIKRRGYLDCCQSELLTPV